MRASDAARLALLAAIWGASFIFMRTLALVLGPALTGYAGGLERKRALLALEAQHACWARAA